MKIFICFKTFLSAVFVSICMVGSAFAVMPPDGMQTWQPVQSGATLDANAFDIKRNEKLLTTDSSGAHNVEDAMLGTQNPAMATFKNGQPQESVDQAWIAHQAAINDGNGKGTVNYAGIVRVGELLERKALSKFYVNAQESLTKMR